MKVGFVSDSLSTVAGGIYEIERCLAQALRAASVDVEAWGNLDSSWERDRFGWGDVPCHILRTTGPRAFGYSPDMLGELAASGCHILHLQHLWMYPSIAVRRWSAKTGNPYLVTPNGMLEPWTLRNSGWKKKIAAHFYENRMLHGAACLQANSEKELLDFRAYGLSNPACIIPNGVDLPEVEFESGILKAECRMKTLLFLGRLHPKKGIVNALRAWANVRKQQAGGRKQDEWQFVVAGWDQGGHEPELKRLCDELGVSWADVRDREADSMDFSSQFSEFQVLFNGPAFGDEKDALLRSADAFILPSFSEGFPMSVLEAWSYRLPVLMTDHCNIPEGFAANAALRIGTDVESISEGMRLLFRSPTSDLRSLGQNGRSLVERQFTWPKVAAQMKDVYKWVLGGGGKPECVSER